ncbi:MAG: hypothetical protein MUF54_06915 [Polyangiaceae bacterium]|nr:hypothetical protein [Polyangiaceae bacterium]
MKSITWLAISLLASAIASGCAAPTDEDFENEEVAGTVTSPITVLQPRDLLGKILKGELDAVLDIRNIPYEVYRGNAPPPPHVQPGHILKTTYVPRLWTDIGASAPLCAPRVPPILTGCKGKDIKIAVTSTAGFNVVKAIEYLQSKGFKGTFYNGQGVKVLGLSSVV